MNEPAPFNIQNFRGIVPLMPFPQVVLFPRTLLPIHLEEAVHVQLVAEAMEQNRLVVLGLMKPQPDTEQFEVFPVGCLAQTLEIQPLENGHMNALLLGLTRVRLGRIERLEPYPMVRVRVMREREIGNRPGEIGPLGLQLMAVYFRVLERSRRDLGRIKELLRPEITLGALGDVIAASLPLPLGYKQRILGEIHPRKRAELLLAFLLEILRHPTLDLDPSVFFQTRVSLN